MIEINLLPKEYRKRTRAFSFDKKLISLAAGVAVILMLLASVTMYQKYQLASIEEDISRASAKRARLQEDIKLIDGLTELKEKILHRMDAIENLDRYRSTWVNVLQDLNSRVPDFMWLTRVAEFGEEKTAQPASKKVPGQQAADTVKTEVVLFDKSVPTQIEGYSFTLNSVASLLVGLMKSDYFDNVDLAFAKEEEVMGISAFKFRVSCDLVFDKALEQAEPLEDVWAPTIAER